MSAVSRRDGLFFVDCSKFSRVVLEYPAVVFPVCLQMISNYVEIIWEVSHISEMNWLVAGNQQCIKTNACSEYADLVKRFILSRYVFAFFHYLYIM